MRPIVKGNWPIDPATGNNIDFTNHKLARPFLEDQTGRYCHFCEMKITNPIAIEHIKNQGLFPGLAGNWNNFLLICDYCNSRKPKNRAPIVANHYWPHKNNTYLAFESQITGVIRVKPTLVPQSRIDKATRTINLYGLDKIADSSGGNDQRYVERLTTIDKAYRRLTEFVSNPPLTTIPTIVDMAGATGFWSVWFKVFEHHPAVLTALLNSPEQRGTATACFPAPNHQPVWRKSPHDI